MNLCYGYSDRPTLNPGEPMLGRIPSNAWHTMSSNAGPLPNAGIQGFGSQLLPRSGDGPTPTVVWNSIILQLIYAV